MVLERARRADDPFQIALLDYQMPQMDGEELARRIKADPKLRDTLLVMLGSVENLEHRKAIKSAGFVGWLVKPIVASELMELLVKVWSAAHHDARSPAGRSESTPRGAGVFTEAYPRTARPPSRTPRPGGRGQRVQSKDPRAHPVAAGLPGRRGGQRHRGGRDVRVAGLRPHLHGRADARDGRAGGHADHSRARASPGRPHPHRGHDRARDGRGPRRVPGRGDGRVPHQAGPSSRHRAVVARAPAARRG